MRVARVLSLVLLFAAPAAADPLTLRFENGFVTLSARNVPVRQVLAEWSRLGQTRVVNAEKVPGGTVTIELAHVPEKQALEVLLRSAAGYLAAPRAQLSAANVSSYDRIIVMPTSSAAPPAPVSAGYRTPAPQMPQQPMAQPQPGFNGMPAPMPAEDQDGSGPVNPDGSPALEPDPDQPAQPAVPALGQGPQVPGQGPGNQNDGEVAQPAQQPSPPPPPGPTPLPPGVITAPAPGQMPTPQKPPDQ